MISFLVLIACFLLAKKQKTHHNDDEVEPTPGVSVILLKTVRHHLDHHLADEDYRESTVGVVESGLEERPLLNVNVFYRLQHQQTLALLINTKKIPQQSPMP